MIQEKQKNIRYAFIGIITIVVGLFLYREALARVIQAVFDRQDSSHGIFVPFISGYFFWMKREIIQKIKLQYDYLGIVLCVAGVFLGFLDMGGYQLQFIGFVVFLSGLTDLFLGRQFFKEISFPIFFLISMVPFPDEAYSNLANFIRDITLEGSILIISQTGITFIREGIMVQLPNALLKVNLGCSGIRYLFSYFIFGIAYAYLYRESNWSRICIVTLTIPISIAASILRLTSIFLLTYFVSPKMADHWPHVFISWIVFFFVLVLCLWSDLYYLARKKHTALL